MSLIVFLPRLPHLHTEFRVEADSQCKNVIAHRQRDGLASAGPIYPDVRKYRPERKAAGLLAGFPCHVQSSVLQVQHCACCSFLPCFLQSLQVKTPLQGVCRAGKMEAKQDHRTALVDCIWDTLDGMEDPQLPQMQVLYHRMQHKILLVFSDMLPLQSKLSIEIRKFALLENVGNIVGQRMTSLWKLIMKVGDFNTSMCLLNFTYLQAAKRRNMKVSWAVVTGHHIGCPVRYPEA